MLLRLIFKLLAFEVKKQKMKVKVLQETFFSLSLDANLNDIMKIKYLSLLLMNVNINEKKMIQIINCFV